MKLSTNENAGYTSEKEEEDNGIPEKKIKLEKDEVSGDNEDIKMKTEAGDFEGCEEGRNVKEISPGRTNQLLFGDEGNSSLIQLR